MTRRVLAGDVGGTKTSVGIYVLQPGARPQLERDASFPSRDYPGLGEVLDEFLRGEPDVVAAAFGIAGPVENGVVDVTNLPWRIAARELEGRLGCAVRLLNDLEATAHATLALDDAEVEVLNPGEPRDGNRCVIAAGTGLGQALLAWDGTRHIVSATEGGHVDFAPRDETEIELLCFLRERHPRVSWERVLSGQGLHAIFEFVVQRLGVASDASVEARMQSEDPSKVVGESAMAGSCPAAERAVDLFVSLYGAQAGNLALTTMALGGVAIAGGIAGKILAKLTTGRFLESFVAKDPFEDLMRRIPVRVVLDPNAPRNGAAAVAASLVPISKRRK